ncbi:hypothetical protein OCU04_006573 [Sclerotinia nivalis]|uniref:Uncharacterized protein n=1 Tax=Sclerotinia nivalis TaxID=352851 RepID=A0A9X0AK76_9HELO|nr:hypothetical protein OCU04_006573 [Sclerotinia nivalis]
MAARERAMTRRERGNYWENIPQLANVRVPAGALRFHLDLPLGQWPGIAASIDYHCDD